MSGRFAEYLIKAVFLLAFALPPSASDAVEIVRSRGGDQLVVFVHGFMSSPETAFKKDEDGKGLYDNIFTVEPYDVDWIEEVVDVGLVSYPSDICSSFSVTEVSQYVASQVEYSRVFERFRRVVS